MQQIGQNGIKFLGLILLFSCSNKKISFSEVQQINGRTFDSKEYYVDDKELSLERRAIHASFRGDYRKALHLKSQLSHENKLGAADSYSSVLQYLKVMVSDTTISEESIYGMKKLLDLYRRNTDKDSIFRNFTNKNALDQIVKEASDYHFTLINEAHYSSQHRAFTNSLLKPLWDKGYRYLALEGLGHTGENLQTRGYATYGSGYYIKESSYANLIRNALKIGYILVPYESTSNNYGSMRDLEQAENIYNATFKKDREGKVLVHAGYSHIFEIGDKNYTPLGAYLKKILDMDIFTIDQESMSERGNPKSENSYYKFALDNFEINGPTVFVNSEKSYLNPIKEGGIDMQVYHPRTNYILGRPDWLINDDNDIYPLPKGINKLEGYFVQAIKANEAENSVPYDQFMIDTVETGIILAKGIYDLRIFNKYGKIHGTSKVRVNY